MLTLRRKDGECVTLFQRGSEKPLMEIRFEATGHNKALLTFFGGEEIRIVRSELLERNSALPGEVSSKSA